MAEGITPTRSALLELRDEQHVMIEGFRFLDEKRMLLAARVMESLTLYRKLTGDYRRLNGEAAAALADAVERHGLDGLYRYPAAAREESRLHLTRGSFFGVAMVEARLELAPWQAVAAVLPSPEAARCEGVFEALLRLAVELAVVTANLNRLIVEYRKTERRARALEDVILPELSAQVAEIGARLEEVDQEEAIRVRLAAKLSQQ